MKVTGKLMSMTLSASMIAALVAGCSTDYSSTSPTPDPIISAEDMALATTGTTVVRQGNYQVLRTTGNITTGVTQFRTLLGALNANTAGEQAAGRREVNWDGVPRAIHKRRHLPGELLQRQQPARHPLRNVGNRLSRQQRRIHGHPGGFRRRIQRVQWDEAVHQRREHDDGPELRRRRFQHAGAGHWVRLRVRGRRPFREDDHSILRRRGEVTRVRLRAGQGRFDWVVVRRCGVRLTGRGARSDHRGRGAAQRDGD